MNAPPESSGYFLETERLGFRQWRTTDLPLAEGLWCDPAVMGYIGGPLKPAGAQARMRLEVQHQQRLGYQYWPIFQRATGEHVGCCGLRPPLALYEAEPGVLEIGAHIAKAFWSGRYGEEAARAVIRLAFGQLGVPALVAGHHPENDASRSLLLRLGFRWTHDAVWDVTGLVHPFYRLDPEVSETWKRREWPEKG